MANPFAAIARKAASLLVPGARRTSFYRGDPITSGVLVDSRQWGNWRGNGSIDYARAVGDGLGSSIIVACLNAIASAMPEPPLRVYQHEQDGEDTVVPGHDLERLVRRPNPYMSWELLSGYIAYAQHLNGNAYLWKARSDADRVVELWPIMPNRIEPGWPDGASTKTWITHYDYKPDDRREPVRLPVEDVIHLRLNIDPDNHRKGRSPLLPLLREVFSDEEASDFLAALLSNFAVPPVLMAPDAKAPTPPSKEQVDKAKENMEQKFSGARRGNFLFTSAPWKATKVGYTPAEMNLDRLRLLPESRVCAVLGVPAIVAGLMVGLEHATYSNAGQLREHFIESKMIPYWRLLEADLGHQLLPEFAEPDQFTLRFDLQDVRALQEDQDAKYKRVADVFDRGLITMNTGLRELGFPEIGDAGNVLLIPNTKTATRPEDLLKEPELGAASSQEDMPALPAPRAQIRELPRGEQEQATRSIKAADLATRLERLRDRLAKQAEADLARFFQEQANRAAERAGKAAAVKDEGDVSDALLPAEHEERLLLQVLEGYYRRALTGVHEIAQDTLSTAFELDDPVTRAYLQESGTNIKGITDTTRDAIRGALRKGQRAGESLEQLAKRLPELSVFSPSRARFVARTEMGIASNRAAMTSYRASGVVAGVEFLDQEGDAECVGWHGRRMTLDEAAKVPYLIHPNCTQARAPLIAGEL